MFQHVLVPLDTSTLAECVLPHLEALVATWPLRVTLLHVLDPAATADSGSWDPLRHEVERERAQGYLEGVASRVAGAAAEVTTAVENGTAAEVIVRMVRTGDHDLILLSSHGRGGEGAFSIGSVVAKVFSHATVSMLVVRASRAACVPGPRLRYRTIVTPLDGSARAECVLPTAAALARAHDGKLEVCQVVGAPELPRRVPLTAEEERLVERLVAANRREAEVYVAEVTKRLTDQGVAAEGKVEGNGNPSAVLRAQFERTEPDLVILSAHGYSGDANLPFGSIVLNLLAFATTSLLVIQDLDRAARVAAEERRATQQRIGH
ncbi:MAG: universal stress protein [Trueperaceae bacterium]